MSEIVFDAIYVPQVKEIRGHIICDSDILRIIRTHFSIPLDPFSKDLERRKLRQYIISPKGYFPSKMLFEILSFIKNNNEFSLNYKVTVDLLKMFAIDSTSYELHTYKDSGYDYYYYQKESITQALKYNSGIIEVGTGGGKTLISAGLFANFRKHKNCKTGMLLVPNIGLVEQGYKDFVEDFGVDFKVSKWDGNNKLDTDSDFIIASQSILRSQYDEHEDFFNSIDILIVDECHGLRRKNKIFDIVKNHPTKYKIGLTGTLLDKKIDEDRFDRWHIFSVLGPIFYTKPSHELREEGFTSQGEVDIISIEYDDEPAYLDPKTLTEEQLTEYTPTTNYNIELEFLITSKFRNRTIRDECKKIDGNVLILVDRIFHGELLEKILEKIPDREVYFVQGSMKVDDREKIKARMEESTNIICIAMNRIFSTGISIDNLPNIILAGGGKSKVRILQTIGRGLRKHKDKMNLRFIDLHDKLKYGDDHLHKRMDHYKQEKYQIKKTRRIENSPD